MAKAGKVHHWKHGWIPLDDYARRILGRKTKAEESFAASELEYQRKNREYNAWRASVGRPVDPDLVAMQEWGNDHQARSHRLTPPPLDMAVVQDLRGGSADKHLVTDATGTRFTPERAALHAKIVNQIVGSAKPQEHPAFVMLGGGAASGKTKAAEEAQRDFPSAVTINPDDIKMMLPEYKQQSADKAAAFTHEESSYLTKLVTAAAVKRRANIVLDAVGNTSVAAVEKKLNHAKANGYSTHARYVSVPTEVAQARATARGIKTGRVVPPSVIAKAHKGVSEVFPAVLGQFDTATLHDNTSEWKPVLSAKSGHSLTIHDPAAYRAFLEKAKS